MFPEGKEVPIGGGTPAKMFSYGILCTGASTQKEHSVRFLFKVLKWMN